MLPGLFTFAKTIENKQNLVTIVVLYVTAIQNVLL